ncbi:hypothetical protein GUJ93_ZPchr0014g47688 [Zizania palustris]|uniref:Uncharacterized protein n=1 Tax=Zizania palustris TaxID=103762 RepID=A0A8J5TEM9_ZIZPA|nr:hypothetical protein GUJ93_ZPchr0014g47688 [Zizania palustris]
MIHYRNVTIGDYAQADTRPGDLALPLPARYLPLHRTTTSITLPAVASMPPPQTAKDNPSSRFHLDIVCAKKIATLLSLPLSRHRAHSVGTPQAHPPRWRHSRLAISVAYIP